MSFSLLHSIWVDLVIILILIFFIHQGFVNGFWSILIDFVSFFGSLLVSLKIYPFISSFLQPNFSFSRSISNALGFLISAVVVEIILSFILTVCIRKLPQKILRNHITKILGVLLSFGQAVILIAFVLTLAISFPVNPTIKSDISKSKIGGFILTKTSGIDKSFPQLTYLTIEPKSRESVPLDNKKINLSVDKVAETEMFNMVNNERADRGINTLTWETKLVVVAEDYAKLMWTDKYFGHYDSNGKDVGDRLQSADILYTIAGENLALAPTVEIAHTGLMNSPGHKANILETRFSKVGIGVIDNIYYGKMFVQVFTD